MFSWIANILFLLVVIVFSVRYYIQVQALPTYEEREVVGIVFWLLMFFVIVEMISIVSKFLSGKDHIPQGKISFSPFKKLKNSIFSRDKDLILLLISFAYLPAIFMVGFFTSSFIFFAVLNYALGSKSTKELILTPSLVLGVIYLFFVILLNSKFPKGILF
jgi:hypothetical protein